MNATYSEATSLDNYSMTVERKETRSGNVSFLHTVFFKGEVYETRKSKREYAVYWMDILNGRKSEYLRDAIKWRSKEADKYRANIEDGGRFSKEQYQRWIEELEAYVERYKLQLAEVENAGSEYDYKIVDQGFTGRPDLAKGTIAIIAA